MKSLSLSIVTPERRVVTEHIESVSCMTHEGELTILPNHTPIIATLKPGEIRFKTPEGIAHYLASSTGYIEVRADGKIVILADTAERLEELELASIEEAKARAQAALAATKRVDDIAFADASAALERELARHRVVERRREQAKLHVRSTE